MSAHSTTYLIRKSLFSSQKIGPKTPGGGSSSGASAAPETYRFYCNKFANDTRKAAETAATVIKTSASALNSNVVSQTSSSIIKKSFSISDILRDHLVFSKLNDYDSKPEFFLNYIDYIEESWAKSYIKSVVHYLGLYATQRLMSTIPKSNGFCHTEKINC